MKQAFVCILLFAMAACNAPATDNKPATNPNSTDEQQHVATPQPQTIDTLCFENKTGNDVFSLKLIVNGNQVSGTLDYTYYQKDGAHGTISGTKQDNLIVVDYNYTIEGSEQVEVIEFKLEDNAITRKTGELTEKDGKLMLKDPEKAPYKEKFTKVNCTQP